MADYTLREPKLSDRVAITKISYQKMQDEIDLLRGIAEAGWGVMKLVSPLDKEEVIKMNTLLRRLKSYESFTYGEDSQEVENTVARLEELVEELGGTEVAETGYEYLCETLKLRSAAEITDYLNEKAQEGWELDKYDKPEYGAVYIWKRKRTTGVA